jgi:aryl-alcohol dehydrogenase (NADP+)
MLYREAETELLPLCRDAGVGVIVYNPLAGGLLSGKHRPEAPPEPGTRFTLGASGTLYRDRYWHTAQFEAVETLRGHCEAKGMNMATVSVAWVLARPEISAAIVGASRAEQLDATLAATELTLDDETRSACEALWWTLPRRPVTR